MTVFRDLSQHILDIVENSITAGATLVYLDIVEDPAANQMVIAVRDNGRGMAPEMLIQVADPWVTTRTTRKVGLGIPFLKQTAEMCGGNFKVESKPRHGALIQATFALDHIDRPPLGDLIGTLLCIVVGNSQLDLVYDHRVGEQAFTFRTREIRDILGADVPLSDPDVLGFIRNALAEGLSSIESRAGVDVKAGH